MRYGCQAGSGSAVRLVADTRGAVTAIAMYRAVARVAKDNKAKQISPLWKAVLA